MRDVAARAGVGIKSVSRVVNGEYVRPETERVIVQAIAELGFSRNDSAALLRQGSTASVGLVLEDIAEPFQSVLTRAVEAVTLANGSILMTASSGEDPARERQVVRAFCARRVDGLIVVPAAHSHRYLLPDIRAGVATVFVDRPADDIDADTILVDNFEGARDGVAHLIRAGHRVIGFIADTAEIFTAAERLRGYTEALAQGRLPFDPALVHMETPTDRGVAEAIERMLKHSPPATAFFTGNSRITIMFLRAMSARKDVRAALVAFDDFELADMLRPGITVVAQDAASMGRVAAELLFRRLGGDAGPTQRIYLRTTLIPRGSGEIPP
ncbi:MAG TPA: LacI family DNA-binding transcriptional regulator [Streptosporangiaceae bacterium]|nr:LacI family DNA-binding transcriptional regulator [Streptosporangiaceae bacterium]